LSFQPVTTKERALIRDAILKGTAGGMDLFYAGDGVWTADVEVGPTGHVYVEGGTPAEVLRRVAAILEEA
jgi:hypothetical protein